MEGFPKGGLVNPVVGGLTTPCLGASPRGAVQGGAKTQFVLRLRAFVCATPWNQAWGMEIGPPRLLHHVGKECSHSNLVMTESGKGERRTFDRQRSDNIKGFGLLVAPRRSNQQE